MSADLETTKSGFDNLVNRIQASDKDLFLNWLREEYLPATGEPPPDYDKIMEARRDLKKISGELKSLVPFEAVLESEKILPPSVGEDTHLNTSNTFNLDAFLYDEEDEQVLVDKGLLPKSRCRDCGSKNIEDIVTLSHSCSHTRLECIFRAMCPSLNGKTVVDVGSRLGAVLYGAFYHSTASKIVGVELNSQFCDLATRITQKYQLHKRIEIINDDVLNVPNILKSADVIVLNNVFEWFKSLPDQIVLWRYLKEVIPSGALIVSIPSLEKSLEHLHTEICVEEWVEEETWADPDYTVDENDADEIFIYRVL